MFKFNHNTIISAACAGLLFIVGSSVLCASQDFREPYIKLLDSGKTKEAIAVIQQLQRSGRVPKDDRWVLQVDLASAARMQGQPQQAIQLLSSLDKIDQLRPEVALESGLSYLLLKNDIQALKSFETATGAGSPSTRMRANLEVARQNFKNAQYEVTVRLCQLVIDDYGKLSSFDLESTPSIKSIYSAARKLLDEARAMLQQSRYGDDFMFYKTGRQAQARGDYQAAIDAYSKIKAPVLADAAGCYIPACLAELGKVSEAVAAYQKFIAADALGLYREEAHLELIRLQAKFAASRAEFQATAKLVDQALKWQEDLVKSGKDIDITSVRFIVQDFPAPVQYTVSSEFGNWHRSKSKPENIINRLTTRWYPSHILAQTYMLGIYVRSQAGDVSGAEKLLAKLEELNKENNERMLSSHASLGRLQRDTNRTAYVIPLPEWSSLTGQDVGAIKLGFFYLSARELESAKQLFTWVDSRIKQDGSNANNWAAVHVGQALYEFYSKNDRGALQQLGRFDTVFRQTSIRPFAQLIKANITAGQRPSGFKDAQRIYQSIITEYDKTPYAVYAQLCMGLSAANSGERTEAIKAFSHLLENHPESEQAKVARTALVVLNAQPVFEKRGPTTNKKLPLPGKVTPVEYSMSFPGGQAKRIDYATVATGDLLRFKITATVKNDCIKLKNFRMRLSEYEPQIAGRDDSKLEYIEAPMLKRGI